MPAIYGAISSKLLGQHEPPSLLLRLVQPGKRLAGSDLPQIGTLPRLASFNTLSGLIKCFTVRANDNLKARTEHASTGSTTGNVIPRLPSSARIYSAKASAGQIFTTRLKDRIIAKVTFSAWSITLHRPRNLHYSIAAFVTDFYFVNHV